MGVMVIPLRTSPGNSHHTVIISNLKQKVQGSSHLLPRKTIFIGHGLNQDVSIIQDVPNSKKKQRTSTGEALTSVWWIDGTWIAPPKVDPFFLSGIPCKGIDLPKLDPFDHWNRTRRLVALSGTSLQFSQILSRRLFGMFAVSTLYTQDFWHLAIFAEVETFPEFRIISALVLCPVSRIWDSHAHNHLRFQLCRVWTDRGCIKISLQFDIWW